MDDERLVKHTVKVQYENGDMSNMLADVPPTETFQHLAKLVVNRKKWKRTWTATDNAKTVAIQWSDNAETAFVKMLPTPKTPKPKRMTAVDKYKAREAHEALFNPK